MASVEDIKSRTDIADVIERYVQLQKAGSHYKALCPFHNERTPSFSVSPERQMFYCFGCGAGGDVVDFVQRIEGLDFVGAMTLLAEQVGLTFERGSAERQERKDVLYEAVAAACLFYQNQLTDASEARSYLARRGVSDATIRVWRIGYAPAQWRALKEHLTAKGYDEGVLAEAGLIKDPQRGGSNAPSRFDTFRDRLIFPICDTAGRVVGFSGRALHEADDTPKYLNSPDTPIFNKSRILYGLDQAKHTIRTMGFSVLVEGQFDLLLSHQHGFRNTVATSGTAVTRDHLVRLSRLSPKLMLAFDSDEAGVSAVEKTAAIALSLSMDVKGVQTPAGDDPADILHRDPAEWKEHMKNAEPVIMFLLHHAVASVSDERQRIKQIGARVLPFVAAIPSRSEQSYFVRQIAEATGVREQALWDDLSATSSAAQSEEGQSPSGPSEQPAAGSSTDSASQRSRKEVVAAHIAELIAWQRSLSQPHINVADLETDLAERLGDEETKAFIAARAEGAETAFQLEQRYTDGLSQDHVTELLRELDIVILEQQFQDTRNKIAEAERAGESDRVRSLMQQAQEIRVQLDAKKKESAA